MPTPRQMSRCSSYSVAIGTRRGYTPDNIRLVCVAVNYALNAWGEDVLHRIVDGISEKRSKMELKAALAGKKSRRMEIPLSEPVDTSPKSE